MPSPSYHDLYITTEKIKRTRLCDLPFNFMVTCTRVGGWELWDVFKGFNASICLGGECSDKWLVLDSNGTILVDSRVDPEDEDNG
jgi:hypothetical protein